MTETTEYADVSVYGIYVYTCVCVCMIHIYTHMYVCVYVHNKQHKHTETQPQPHRQTHEYQLVRHTSEPHKVHRGRWVRITTGSRGKAQWGANSGGVCLGFKVLGVGPTGEGSMGG